MLVAKTNAVGYEKHANNIRHIKLLDRQGLLCAMVKPDITTPWLEVQRQWLVIPDREVYCLLLLHATVHTRSLLGYNQSLLFTYLQCNS